MRLPTLGVTVDHARAAAARFPFVILSGIVAATAGILALTQHDPERYWRIFASATLGLPLFIAGTTWAERRAARRTWQWVTRALGTVALVAFFLAWPHWSETVRGLRYLQLAVAFHLLVAFFPFFGRDEPNALWQYNRILFLRFLIAALYAVTIFVGLALALVALDQLFGVDLPVDAYARLWMLTAFVFNPWFFVSGIPTDVGALENRRDYPAGLRIFVQYVLVPLVALYLGILTAYLAKALITASWPSGWIGYLVSGVSALGIFAWLLVRPLEEWPGQQWVRRYARWFYIAIAPAIVMLWLAIGKRIAQYGVTEPRYFLTVLSLWVAGIAIYFTVRRAHVIKVVPASLCALALLTFWGPWGAYRVSVGSQVGRLRDALVANGYFTDGRVRPGGRPLSPEAARDVRGALEYLISTHGTAAIDGWFHDSLATIDTVAHGTAPSSRSTERADAILAHLGIRAASATAPTPRLRYTYGGPAKALEVTGWDLMVPLHGAAGRIAVDDDAFVVVTPTGGIRIVRGGTTLVTIPAEVLVAAVESATASPRGAANGAARPSVSRQAAGANTMVYLRSLWANRTAGSVTLTMLDGELLLKLR